MRRLYSLLWLIASVGYAQKVTFLNFQGMAVENPYSAKPLAAQIQITVDGSGCRLTVSPPLGGTGPCKVKSYDDETGRFEIISGGVIHWSGTVKGNLATGTYRLKNGSQTGRFLLTFTRTVGYSPPVQQDSRTIAQYVHTVWGSKDGAPSVVTALAQSADGYLWLGSPNGLYRFDGMVFTRYQPPSGTSFPGPNVVSLLARPNGDLWIGFRSGGVSLIRNGSVTSYTSRDGALRGDVWFLEQDKEGAIWAASSSGLARFEGGQWKEIGSDWNFPGKFAMSIFCDAQGTLWVATENTLVFLAPGSRRFQLTGIQIGQVAQFAQAASGKLWMAEVSRGVRTVPLPDKRHPSDTTEIKLGSISFLFDKDGALWITTIGDGLRRSRAPELLGGLIEKSGPAIESYTAQDGLSDDYVRAILQDREGNIWVGTNNGLDRFRKTNVVPVSFPFKLQQPVWVAEDGGDIWMEDRLSVARYHQGRADRSDIFPVQDQPLSVYRDPSGAIFWLCGDAIYRYHAGRYTRIELPASFPKHYIQMGIAAAEDGSGNFWMSAVTQGLFYRKNQRWEQVQTRPDSAKLSPTTTFTDWMGRAWFGYEGGAMIVANDGKIQRVFYPDQSPVGSVKEIAGLGHHLWVGGDAGLAFLDGDHFRRISPADAETFGPVMGVKEISDGSIWLAETRGVIQIPATEVHHALSNPSYRVKYRLFTISDGLPGAFAGVSTNSRELQGTDGKLWFVTSGGAAWIDPANISTNTLPPPVLIRSVAANGSQLNSLTNLRLPPRTTNLQISYTALSLAASEKVAFRYMLEGVDKEWQDAGTRREAFYTRLGPGNYRFRVIACNNDGIWNEEGARLDFGIAPAWFQTYWFFALCVAIAFLLAWALYRMRVRQIADAMSARFDERLSERTRIARDLHDTLLQTIQGSKLVADSALKQSHDPAPMRGSMEKLSVWLGRATEEGRAALNSLRTSTIETNDLAEAFRRSIDECRIHSTMEASFSVNGKVSEMHPIVRDEVYRIGYEGIRNACAHSQATQLQVELTYAENLILCIKDNGVGIHPAIASEGRQGHFGLQGMRERAQRIMAKLTVETSPDSGTEIKLVVPGSIIYRNATSSRPKLSAIKSLLERMGLTSHSNDS